MLQYYTDITFTWLRPPAPPPPPNFALNGRNVITFILPHQVLLNENIYLLTQTTQEKQKQKDNYTKYRLGSLFQVEQALNVVYLQLYLMGVKVLFVYWNQNWKLTNQCMRLIFFCLVASILYKNFSNKLLLIADKTAASWKTMKYISIIYKLQSEKIIIDFETLKCRGPNLPLPPTLQPQPHPPPPHSVPFRFSWHPHALDNWIIMQRISIRSG